MIYTPNLRSQIYEPLEALKEPFNSALSYLKTFHRDYYAERASKLIQRAFSVLKRLLNYRCDDFGTTLYLEEISRLLNIVVIRTRELYPQIAKVAYDIYEQFITLFPGELSLQLELFNYGELTPPIIPSELIFPQVKRFLNYWLNPFTEQQQVTRWNLAQRKSSPFKRLEGEQLCLDFTGASQPTLTQEPIDNLTEPDFSSNPGSTKFGIKFTRRERLVTRPITGRRLKAAERTLQQQRNRFPLLSDWVAEEQPTAEERLERFQEADIERERSFRQYDADTWRRARVLLRTLPLGERLTLIAEWNKGYHPRTASYFADFVTQRVPGAKEKSYQELLDKARDYRDQKIAKLLQR